MFNFLTVEAAKLYTHIKFSQSSVLMLTFAYHSARYVDYCSDSIFRYLKYINIYMCSFCVHMTYPQVRAYYYYSCCLHLITHIVYWAYCVCVIRNAKIENNKHDRRYIYRHKFVLRFILRLIFQTYIYITTLQNLRVLPFSVDIPQQNFLLDQHNFVKTLIFIKTCSL